MNRKTLLDLLKRIGAYLVDVTLLFIVYGLTQTFLLTPLRNLWSTDWMRSGLWLEAYVLVTVSFPVWLYFALSESSAWQATLGKRLLGLRVTGLAGQHLSFGQALLRTVIKLLPWEFTHLIVTLPTPMWTDPQAGADDPVMGLRYALFSGVYILLGVYLVTIWVTPRKQSVHDLVAQTLVIGKA